MLDARARLLGGGAYRPIADAVAAAALPDPGSASPGSIRIADLGCGTGYYASRLGETAPGAEILLADRSPDAVRAALRANPTATGVVLDLWRPLPIRDGTADVILNVFAPRNPAEFARILRPHGRLVAVVPRPEHLRELRQDGLVLDVPPEKANAVTEQFGAAGLVRRRIDAVDYVLDADREARELLAGMGPSAHHAASLNPDPDPTSTAAVTVAVDVLTFAHTSHHDG
jgi:23S rRNA (guanine745-N1)-methyltransferase